MTKDGRWKDGIADDDIEVMADARGRGKEKKNFRGANHNSLLVHFLEQRGPCRIPRRDHAQRGYSRPQEQGRVFNSDLVDPLDLAMSAQAANRPTGLRKVAVAVPGTKFTKTMGRFMSKFLNNNASMTLKRRQLFNAAESRKEQSSDISVSDGREKLSSGYKRKLQYDDIESSNKRVSRDSSEHDAVDIDWGGDDDVLNAVSAASGQRYTPPPQSSVSKADAALHTSSFGLTKAPAPSRSAKNNFNFSKHVYTKSMGSNMSKLLNDNARKREHCASPLDGGVASPLRNQDNEHVKYEQMGDEYANNKSVPDDDFVCDTCASRNAKASKREQPDKDKAPRKKQKGQSVSDSGKWVVMWNAMKDDGWSCIKGTGLVEWYYLHPTCKGMKKSHLLDTKKEGTDYFTSEDDLKSYARLNLGWRTSGSDSLVRQDRKIKEMREDDFIYSVYNKTETSCNKVKLDPLPKQEEKSLESIVKKNSRNRDKSFSERLAALEAYKEKHGHINVKKSDDASLRQWIYSIRSTYVKGKLSEDRIALLNTFGFDWGKRNGSVAPASAPKLMPDGLFARPIGRARKGYDWDYVRGVWVPVPTPSYQEQNGGSTGGESRREETSIEKDENASVTKLRQNFMEELNKEETVGQKEDKQNTVESNAQQNNQESSTVQEGNWAASNQEGTESEHSDLKAQAITPPLQTNTKSRIKQEETDEDDDGQTLCFFRLVMSGVETDNVVELPRKQDLTFADLRCEIEEDIDLPWDSFKFTLAGGTVCPSRKQEKKWNVCCRDYGLTKKGDGSCERPYLVFIKEANA